MTRRTFSALAAAPAFATPSGKIRAAMIGTGHGHAASKVRALRGMPEYEFVGIARPVAWDPHENDAFREVRTMTVKEILDDASIEMVALESAGINSNLDHAELAVRAGKFVHFDKPPGADLARFRQLLADAAARGRVVQMGYQWRYHAAMQTAMDAARQGWLGKVYRFSASIDKLIDQEERNLLAKFKGGMMFSEGCHLIDRATALLGKPKRITSYLRHDAPVSDGLMDNNLVILEYDNALAEISMAGFDAANNRRRYLEIIGMNGSARVQQYSQSRLTFDLANPAGPYKAGEQQVKVAEPAGLAYTPDFAELAAVIRQGAKPTYSAEHDLMTHEVLLSACGMLSAA